MATNDHGCVQLATSRSASSVRTDYQVCLTLSVSDAESLWLAAAARLMTAPGMDIDSVIDVIGPLEDPSIAECIMTLAKPEAMPGCALSDMSVDLLGPVSPRVEAEAETVLVKSRRGTAGRRATPLHLCPVPSAPLQVRTI